MAAFISPVRVNPYEGWFSKKHSALYSASPSSCQAQFIWSLPAMAYHHWCAFSCTTAYIASSLASASLIIVRAGYSIPPAEKPVCTTDRVG